MTHATQLTDRPNAFLFNRSKMLYVIAILLILGIGLAIRFYDLYDAPLDFHPTRQLFSAIKARGMYYENLPEAADWQRDFAVQQWKIQGLIEPPVMERITASFYKLLGMEALWVPRVLSILFWTIAGLFLLSMTAAMIDKNAGVIAFLLFMINPYTAIASRAFQPEALMVMLMVIAMWGLMRWVENESFGNAIIAGLFGGLAIFIKSVVIFPLVLMFVAVILLHNRGLKQTLRSGSVWLMAFLVALPYLAYMLYGLWVVKALQSQFSLRFFPQLWIDPVFWLRWNEMISKVVGREIFLASIIGIFLLRKPVQRIFLTSLFAGYFIYGMVLPYHISTHDYYQMPLVPVVIIGASAVFSQIISAIRKPGWFAGLIVIGILLFYTAINAWDVRVALKRDNYQNEVLFWQEMGTKFDPRDSVIGITQDYGYRLNYWGWQGIENWMSLSDFALRELAGQEFDIQTLFEEQTAGKDYFLVTQMDEFNKQTEVKQILVDHYVIREETSDYIIFDLNENRGN